MFKYTSEDVKSLNKKQELKKYNMTSLYNLLKLGDLKEHYPPDHISENGKTINDYNDFIKKFSNCSSNLTYELNTESKEFKMIDGNQCGLRCACSVCSSVKRNSLIQDILPKIKVLNRIPDIKFYMITLTVKNNMKASIAYDELREASTKFFKMGQKRKNNKRSSGEASKIIGSVYSVETSKGKDDLKHVHAHCLVVANDKIDYSLYNWKLPEARKLIKKYGWGNVPEEELLPIAKKTIMIDKTITPVSKISEEWYKATKNEAINIKVNSLEPGYSAKYKKFMSIEDQVFEVIKYEVKAWEFLGKDILDIHDDLSGKRQTTKRGIFTNRFNSVKEFNDLIRKNNLVDMYNSLVSNDEKVLYKESEILTFILNNDSKKYDIDNEYPFDDKNKDYINSIRAQLLNNYKEGLKELTDLLKRKDICVINKKWIEAKFNLKKAFRWCCNELIQNAKDTHRRTIKKPKEEALKYFSEVLNNMYSDTSFEFLKFHSPPTKNQFTLLLNS